MKRIVNPKSILLSLCFISSGVAQPEASHPTDWLKSAKTGVFMHFLPNNAKEFAKVRDFDVNSLGQQLEAVGAGYLIFTLGQNSGYFNSPNAAYDRVTGGAPGERCALRDLPADLFRVLNPKGIQLLLYLPCQVPNRDARAQKAFGLKQGPADQPIDTAFAHQWAEVIREWSVRYGDSVAGWWFDGAYEWIGFSEKIANLYANAVRDGNPKAILTFNPGVKLIRWTQTEDYTAGELVDPFEILPLSRWVDGSQWHALTFLGSHWGSRDTRFPAGRWSQWVARVVARGGVVSLDAGPNWDPDQGPIGCLSGLQFDQLTAIHAALDSLP